MQIHFWEYMQPGYDAIGFISCTGTNFLIRANAFGMVREPPPPSLEMSHLMRIPANREIRVYARDAHWKLDG